MQIKVTDKKRQFETRTYDVEATETFLGYMKAVKQFIADNGIAPPPGGASAQAYYGRFTCAKVRR